jgi:hypothetical protein
MKSAGFLISHNNGSIRVPTPSARRVKNGSPANAARSGNQMKKLVIALVLISSPAVAQNTVVTEPVCEPTGRTSKGDLVYSMECRNIPGLPPGDKPAGYNPYPRDVIVPQPDAASPKVPESK